MTDTIFFDAPSAGGAQYEVRSGDDEKVLTFTFSDFTVKSAMRIRLR
ncbi:MAG: hypothetical protein QOK35_1224 [Pseudonocardiales bacterium]|nr:hypothetical protein [Pseudonocardiales bacterium]